MTRLPTTTTSGNTHYPNCYKNLQQDYAAVNRQLVASLANSKLLHAEIDRLLTKKDNLQLANDQLQTESCRSVENYKEMKYYRRSARVWCVGFTMLLASWLAVAVWL